MDRRVTENLEGVSGLKKRKMGPFGIAFMLYCLVAAGAFGIEEMIPSSGPGLTIVILAVFPIVWALPICLMVSELSALMPREGGIYVWVKEALGEMWGFCTCWWSTICTYLCSATYVVLVVGYAGKFIDMTNVQAMAVKVAMILIFTVINLIGLKEVSVVNTVFSVMIIAVFALVTVVGFANWEFNPLEPFTPEGESVVSSLGGSVCIAIWMYCGYECVAYVSGEIENPKVIPKGFFIAMPLIALSYILPTVAGLCSIGSWESWSTESTEGTVGYADVLTQNLGQAWGAVFIIIAIISQCAIFNTYITAGSRGFLVMSDDNLSPKFLGKVDKKRGMPYWGIILIAAVTMIMSTFDFSTIIILVGPVCIVVYFTISVSLIVLRKKYPVDKRGDIYYIKGGKKVIYAITALVFIVGIAGIIVNGTEYFIMSFITIGSGLVAYIIFKLLYGGLYRKSPDRYPINKKTKLATGDVMRIGLFIFLCGILAFFGALFITWYEGSYGEEYYLEAYEKGILSDFWLMIKILKFGGIISGIVGIILLILGKRYDDTERIKKESL